MATANSRVRIALLMIVALLLCLRVDTLRWTVLPVLTALLGVMSAREIHRMAGHLNIEYSRTTAMTLAGLVVLSGMLSFDAFVVVLPVLLSGAMILLFLMQMRVYGIPSALSGVAAGSLTMLYVALPLSLALQVLQYDRLFLFFALVMIWSADSGAYFVGRRFGKTKMAPTLSPKKTVEGLLGGVLTCCVVALLFKLIVSDVAFAYPMIHIVPLAAVIAIVAPLGDLSESVLKRDAGVKDSGHSLGGHGGILDRIDSMLFCMPICYAYLRLVWASTGQ